MTYPACGQEERQDRKTALELHCHPPCGRASAPVRGAHLAGDSRYVPDHSLFGALQGMPSVSDRLGVVRLYVEELWMLRRDGRFAALEDVLVDFVNSKPHAINRRRGGERRNNVIPLSDYLERRRGERRSKPP